MFTINFYFCVCEYQKKFLSPRAHYAREIRKHSFISMVRPTIHTNVMKREPFKLLFKLGAVWTENVSVILWLPCPSFPQTPIQILWCSVHGKTFHASFFFLPLSDIACTGPKLSDRSTFTKMHWQPSHLRCFWIKCRLVTFIFYGKQLHSNGLRN